MHLYLKMNLPEEAVKKQKQLLEFNPKTRDKIRFI